MKRVCSLLLSILIIIGGIPAVFASNSGKVESSFASVSWDLAEDKASANVTVDLLSTDIVYISFNGGVLESVVKANYSYSVIENKDYVLVLYDSDSLQIDKQTISIGGIIPAKVDEIPSGGGEPSEDIKNYKTPVASFTCEAEVYPTSSLYIVNTSSASKGFNLVGYSWEIRKEGSTEVLATSKTIDGFYQLPVKGVGKYVISLIVKDELDNFSPVAKRTVSLIKEVVPEEEKIPKVPANTDKGTDKKPQPKPRDVLDWEKVPNTGNLWFDSDILFRILYTDAGGSGISKGYSFMSKEIKPDDVGAFLGDNCNLKISAEFETEDTPVVYGEIKGGSKNPADHKISMFTTADNLSDGVRTAEFGVNHSPEGRNFIHAEMSDVAGNKTKRHSINLGIDKQAPDIDIDGDGNPDSYPDDGSGGEGDGGGGGILPNPDGDNSTGTGGGTGPNGGAGEGGGVGDKDWGIDGEGVIDIPTNKDQDVVIEVGDGESGLAWVGWQYDDEVTEKGYIHIYDADTNTDSSIEQKITLTLPHNGLIRVIAVDKAGYSSFVKFKVTNIDKIAPELKLVNTTPDWTNKPVVIEATAEDFKSTKLSSGIPWYCASGIANVWLPEYKGSSKDKGTAKEYDGWVQPVNTGTVIDPVIKGGIKTSGINLKKWVGTLSVTTQGEFTIIVQDYAGSATTAKIKVTNYELGLPTIPKDTAPDSWVSRVPTLTPSDSTAESGIAKYEYRVKLLESPTGSGKKGRMRSNFDAMQRTLLSSKETAGWITYDKPVAFTKEGIYTFESRAISVAGNISPVKESDIKCDYTAPSITKSKFNNEETLTVEVQDIFSGIALDGGKVSKRTTDEFVVKKGGKQKVTYTDLAGNTVNITLSLDPDYGKDEVVIPEKPAGKPTNEKPESGKDVNTDWDYDEGTANKKDNDTGDKDNNSGGKTPIIDREVKEPSTVDMDDYVFNEGDFDLAVPSDWSWWEKTKDGLSNLWKTDFWGSLGNWLKAYGGALLGGLGLAGLLGFLFYLILFPVWRKKKDMDDEEELEDLVIRDEVSAETILGRVGQGVDDVEGSGEDRNV